MGHEFKPPHFEVYASESGDIAIKDEHGECVLIGIDQVEILIGFIRLVAVEVAAQLERGDD